MKNKVALVGCATQTRDDVDYNDPDLDIWVLNESATKDWCKRADLVLQIHQEEIWRSPVNRGDKEHGEWLKSGNTPPVYMLKKYDDVPNSIAYPFDEIIETLLPNFEVVSEMGRKKFFTSTISYMFALAIYMGYKEIHTFGIELADEDEYRNQLPSAMFWTGIAIGKGIKWVSHSQMFDVPIYPYETFVGMDKAEFSSQLKALQPKRDIAQQEYIKKKEACEVAVKLFEDTAAHKDEMEIAIKELGEAAGNFGVIDGAMQENERYLGRSTAMEGATGTYVFSRHEFARDQAGIGVEREKERINFMNHAVAGQRIIRAIEAKGKKFDSERRSMFKDLRNFIEGYIRMSVKMGMYTGAIQEDSRFMDILEENKKKMFDEIREEAKRNNGNH